MAVTESSSNQGCPEPVKSCDYLSMVNGKLTIQEINTQQCQLMMNHRERVLKQTPEVPTNLIDIQWIQKYAKRFRNDLVNLGLAHQPK